MSKNSSSLELIISDMSFIKDPRGYLTAAAAVSLQLPIFVSISTTRIILGLHVLTHTQTKKTRTRLRPFEINYSQKICACVHVYSQHAFKHLIGRQKRAHNIHIYVHISFPVLSLRSTISAVLCKKEIWICFFQL